MISTFTSNETDGLPTEISAQHVTSGSWSGFSVKYCNRSSDSTHESISQHHSLQFNIGAPFSLACKSNGRWNAEICNTGNIVALLGPGKQEDMKWDGNFNMLEVTFDTSFIDNLLEKENFRFRELRNAHDPILKGIVARLCEDTASNGFIERLYNESLILVCAIHLGTTYAISEKKIFSPKGKLSSCQLKTVIDHVRLRIQGIVTLEELAASIHLSVFHFSRLFKNTTGISPYQFVLRMKIEYAQKFIKRRESIGDIADRLGFTDSAHFCNAFKKFTGKSPLQFNMIN